MGTYESWATECKGQNKWAWRHCIGNHPIDSAVPFISTMTTDHYNKPLLKDPRHSCISTAVSGDTQLPYNVGWSLETKFTCWWVPDWRTAQHSKAIQVNPFRVWKIKHKQMLNDVQKLGKPTVYTFEKRNSDLQNNRMTTYWSENVLFSFSWSTSNVCNYLFLISVRKAVPLLAPCGSW